MSRLRDFLVAPRNGELVADGSGWKGTVGAREPATGSGSMAARRGRGRSATTSRGRGRRRATAAPGAGGRGECAGPRRLPRRRRSACWHQRDLPAAAAGVGLALGGGRRPSSSASRRLPSRRPCARRRAPRRRAWPRPCAPATSRPRRAAARGRPPPRRGAHGRRRPRPGGRGRAATVLAVAGRDEEVDRLLAARDAILVALPSSAEPALARLALAGLPRSPRPRRPSRSRSTPPSARWRSPGRGRRARSSPPWTSCRPGCEERRRCSRVCADSSQLRGSAVTRLAATLPQWRSAGEKKAGERRDGGAAATRGARGRPALAGRGRRAGAMAVGLRPPAPRRARPPSAQMPRGRRRRRCRHVWSPACACARWAMGSASPSASRRS